MTKYFLLICFYLVVVNSENILCPLNCVCDMTNGLRSAKCNGQKLNSIEAGIPEQVQYIDVSDNVISRLDDYIFSELKITNLIVLDMSNNMISVISLRAFVGLKNLQILDLSNNVIHTIAPDLFESNTNLKKLILSGNNFARLTANPFLESNSLEVLDISNCLIPYIHSEFFSKLPSLQTIDISENFLIQLDVTIFQNLLQLKQLKFYNNKINCNDKTTELIEYLQQKQITFENMCQKVEKSQKMIQIDNDEINHENSLDWNFDGCDIETNNIEIKANETNCEIIYDHKLMSLFLIGITFSCGILSGIFISCSYITYVHILNNRRQRNRRRTRRLRRRTSSIIRRPREQFLLAENSFDIGLSTPVLSRARTSNIYV